jgi:hypothetical protein
LGDAGVSRRGSMGHLRRKVDGPDETQMIHNVRGAGFILRAGHQCSGGWERCFAVTADESRCVRCNWYARIRFVGVFTNEHAEHWRGGCARPAKGHQGNASAGRSERAGLMGPVTDIGELRQYHSMRTPVGGRSRQEMARAMKLRTTGDVSPRRKARASPVVGGWPAICR